MTEGGLCSLVNPKLILCSKYHSLLEQGFVPLEIIQQAAEDLWLKYDPSEPLKTVNDFLINGIGNCLTLCATLVSLGRVFLGETDALAARVQNGPENAALV